MEAGQNEKAIGYWLQAGKSAAARSANLGAIAHLRRGIEASGRLPAGEDRDGSELDLQLVLGPCLIATEGRPRARRWRPARARERERLESRPNTCRCSGWRP
jgi:predicted ATPase